jgi:hypothetical protein
MLMTQPYGWIQKFCRHKVGCHFPYVEIEYNNSLDLMQAPEAIFLRILQKNFCTTQCAARIRSIATRSRP